MRREISFLILLSLFCVLPAIFPNNNVVSSSAATNESSIYLDGNVNTTINFPGMGTASDPYIIQNLVFTQCQSSYFIKIQNFNNYFILRNVQVDFPYNCYNGIPLSFNNMTHLSLMNISMSNFPTSLYIPYLSIYNSSDVTLKEIDTYKTAPSMAIQSVTGLNLQESNTSFSISDSNYISVYNNKINGSGGLDFDTNFVINNNTIRGQLSIQQSSYGLIEKNTLFNSTSSAVTYYLYLEKSSNLTIYNNFVAYLPSSVYFYTPPNSYGIYIHQSINDTFLFNTVKNLYCGIGLVNSSDSNYIENSLSNDYYGFYAIISSRFNVFQDNHFQKISWPDNYDFDQSSVSNIINSIPYTKSLSFPNYLLNTSTSISSSTSISTTSPGLEIGIVMLAIICLFIRKIRVKK